MRRPAPTLPISPQQLKHFAAATVALTCVLAMFAGGEDASVAAQIQATQAKNDLVAAEQKKLGTKQLATHMKVKTNASAGFGEDSDGGFGDSSGSSGGASSARGGVPIGRSQGPTFLPPSGLSSRPDGKITRRTMVKPKGQEPADGAESDGQAGSGVPDMSRLSNAIDASRQRSGSAGANGD